MSRFSVYVPSSMDELAEKIRQANPSTKILAGGTDLLVSLKYGEIAPDEIIDLSALDCLRMIEEDSEYLTIGSMVTFSELEYNPLIRCHANCLYEASLHIGSTQIRNMATIGGNIANAAPAADSVAALLSLNAELLFLDREGNKWSSLDDFLFQKVYSVSQPTRVIQAIRFRKPPRGSRSAFSKLGLRSSVTISQLILSGVTTIEPYTRVIENAKVVLGAVGPRSFVDKSTSDWLKGQIADNLLKTSLTERLSHTITAAIPNRTSMPYKRIAISGLVDNIFDQLFLIEER